MNNIINNLIKSFIVISTFNSLSFINSLILNFIFCLSNILIDVFSRKSIHSIFYLQVLFIINIFINLSNRINFLIIGTNLLVGIDLFNIYNINSFIRFLLYIPFLDLYPKEKKDSYKIIYKNYDISKKSIVFIAGLLQKADREFDKFKNELLN